MNINRKDSLDIMLRRLRLPGFVTYHQETAVQAERQGWSFGQFLHQLAEMELEERRIRRIARNLHRSKLPGEKTLATLDLARFKPAVQKQIPSLCEGQFLNRAENILAFGLPGRGKTHLVCAIGHELIQRGYTVFFTPTYQIVQRLLLHKRELTLEKYLSTLDRFDVVVLDDIGYVQQDRDEMEVLFTFLAERYERKSVMITSNLVFSKWDRIFKDPMTTAAAIDRLVHHSTILELNSSSYRTEVAQQRIRSTHKKDSEGNDDGEV